MNKTAIITGAAHGIGRCIVEKLISDGYNVFVTDIDSAGLNETINMISEKHPEKSIFGHPFDLCDPNSSKLIVEKTLEKFDSIDVIVNNAADQTRGGIEETDLSVWNKVIAVNLTAPFLLCKFAYESLKKTNGSIIMLGSVVGNQPIPDRTVYSVSKAALASLGKALACEMGKWGIRVNTIAPGHVMTDGKDTWDIVYPEEIRNVFPISYPMKRVAYPEEIANLVSFLASGSSSFITGATIPIDGGLSTMCPETSTFLASGLYDLYSKTNVNK